MNVIELLNTIRDNASSDYQDRIPEATQDNIASIQSAMVDDENINVANEFMTALLNKVVKTVVHTKRFANPMKPLKKGKKPLGDDVEEIYNNFLKGEEYDPTGAKLLERKLPDTKAVYHRMNSKQQYPITVSREMLQKAFTSYDKLESYISSIIDALYNSAELDEFLKTKELIALALSKNALKVIDIDDPLLSKENGQEFIKAVKTVSGLMAFPSDAYNSYLTAQSKDKKAITTFSRTNEQVLILDTATHTALNVDVLASIFNMTVAEFNETKKVVIDHFPDPDVRAVLVDEQFFQIFDDLYTITSFYNGQGLYTNYWLNVWQTFAYSILVNGVAFKVKTV